MDFKQSYKKPDISIIYLMGSLELLTSSQEGEGKDENSDNDGGYLDAWL